MNIILRIFFTALALLLAAYLVPGIIVESLYVAIITAVVLGLVNTFVRPILVILTLPITILSLGLFIFILNALLFLVVASFVPGFTVTGFIPALLGTLIVSVVSAFTSSIRA